MNGVLITAGGNGIGRAMGQAFAAAGFRVWVTDVEAASLEACPADWQKSLVDTSDEWQVAQMFEGERLLATGEHMLIHVSLETRKASVPSAQVAENLERIATAHRAL